MSQLRALLCLIIFAALPAAAQNSVNANLSTPLIADTSQNNIEIRSDFNGTQLLVFGARNAPGEIVIALRGPKTNAQLRRKERIAGMWMHVDQRKYFGLPVFYAIASTKPLNRLAPPTLLQSLGLGENRIILASNSTPDEVFDLALAASFKHKTWWQSPFGKITYFGESLFKARIDLPDTLPSGEYTTEVYLFNNGKLVGFQMIPLNASKTGLDAAIANAAIKNGALYGLIAILMALFGGWLGHRIFYRPHVE